ncbi:MAG: oligosaccharide flippase family protein [Nanoarchaeota archaeon]
MIKLNKKLLSGSIILLITFGLFNLMGYIFHFSMARMLSIADYGIIVTLFSIIYILAIFSESIQTVITKYSANEDKKGKLKNIFKKTLKKAFALSILFFFLYIILAFPLSKILKIDYALLALNGLIIFSIFFMPISRGIMQGRKMFMSLGINMIIESSGKLIFPILFVLLGWKLYGVIGGVILATFTAFAFSFYFLKPIINAKEEKAQTLGIYNYTTPVFIIIFTILIFYSLDVIIAKIVFSPEVAGYYAISSILAKTIFFGTQPIGKAMFPMTSERKEDEKKIKIFFNALLIIIILIIFILALFYFFSEEIIRIFSGKSIIQSSEILIYVSIATSFISITNLNLLYKASRNEIKGSVYLPLFILFEIAILMVFSGNLFEFSLAYMTASAILLWGSAILLKK